MGVVGSKETFSSFTFPQPPMHLFALQQVNGGQREGRVVLFVLFSFFRCALFCSYSIGFLGKMKELYLLWPDVNLSFTRSESWRLCYIAIIFLHPPLLNLHISWGSVDNYSWCSKSDERAQGPYLGNPQRSVLVPPMPVPRQPAASRASPLCSTPLPVGSWPHPSNP